MDDEEDDEMRHTRFKDVDDWFELWFDDKKAMVETMISNMVADLEAGYDYFGKAIAGQREMIAEYKKQFDAEVEMFKTMDEVSVQRWCFYDMKKRGAID